MFVDMQGTLGEKSTERHPFRINQDHLKLRVFGFKKQMSAFK